jgi:hypothetical protein
MILDVNDVLEHVDNNATAPTKETLLVAWNKVEAKDNRILLNEKRIT